MSERRGPERPRPPTRRSLVPAVVVGIALIAGACGGGDEPGEAAGSGSSVSDGGDGRAMDHPDAPDGGEVAAAGLAGGRPGASTPVLSVEGGSGGTVAGPPASAADGSGSGGQTTTTDGTDRSTTDRSTISSSTRLGQTTTTGRTTTSAAPSPGGRFATLSPGSSLPSGATCSGRVRPAPEVRSGNAVYNRTGGSGPNGRYPRADGDFVGTTDEIIQWAACKWGIDEDWVRAQAAIESWWDMTTGGDRTGDQASCHPDLRTSSGTCPESIGLLQVRYGPHEEAFENADAIRSTAYNIDYAYAVWRACYEGELDWLNTVERGRDYGAGDLEGCLGVWFSGRWYTDAAVDYIARIRDYRQRRVWEQPDFLGYGS